MMFGKFLASMMVPFYLAYRCRTEIDLNPNLPPPRC
jgi:hypothetical protein